MNEQNKKVLIVDDEEEIRDMLSYGLNHQGYKVITAADGQEALDLLRHESFDVILLDIVMPRMYGLRFLEQLRTIKHKIPATILMTGSSADEIIEEALNMGAIACLNKPFEISHLLSTINTILNSSIAAKYTF